MVNALYYHGLPLFNMLCSNHGTLIYFPIFYSILSLNKICVFKIRSYVSEAFTFSVGIGEKDNTIEKLKMERLRDYNNQITSALIVQAILPTFEVIAMSTQILLPIFYPSGTTVFIIVYTVIPLYFAPVINPLSTIFLVKPYRRAVLQKIFGRNNVEMTRATIKNNTGMPTSNDQQRPFNTVAPVEHIASEEKHSEKFLNKFNDILLF
uniref:G_PROTEIN_RECEP_F1_2 domain-containing protein n=1 Tax=Meloidogyne hapla TaxID=6305 RepID=A0A1I8BY21_MELHA